MKFLAEFKRRTRQQEPAIAGATDNMRGRPQTATPGNGAAQHTPWPGPWSEYSQRAKRKIIELREMISRGEAMIAIVQSKLDKADELAIYQTHAAIGGQSIADYNLPLTISHQQVLKEQVKQYQTALHSLQCELEAILHPSAADMETRRLAQGQLAHLARVKLATERQTADEIENLRRLLNKRQELVRAMKQHAEIADFSPSDDPFFEGPFDALASALPYDLMQRSEKWTSTFLGHGKPEGSAYVVTEKMVTLRESLADAGLYVRGEEVFLSDEEAKNLKSAVAPADSRAAASP